MKKTIYTIAVLSLLSGLIITGCNTPSEKVENSAKEVEKANQNLNEANLQYEEDFNTYRSEISNKIAANEQSVVDFKARIENEKSEAKFEYNKKIEVLEKKNSDMKKKLADYKADGKEHWESFKTEFNHDMDELGSAFKDLTVDNVKK